MSIIKTKDFMFLHLILLLYSLTGIFSKLAASNPFMSIRFMIFYGIVLFNLILYALLWQQVLKRMPLTVAFANKAVVIVWGIIWGMVVFGEKLRLGMILGGLIIIAGVLLVVSDDK